MIVAVRQDLVPIVVQRANELGQNPNLFVNFCLDGCLQAMEAADTIDIPVVKMHRTLTGKTFYTSDAVMKIISTIAPEAREMDRCVHGYWLELVSKHEGKMTSEILKGYYKVAVKMNMERVAHEKEIKKLQSKTS